jgi:D-alanyl-D-alanine dipeptidase
MSVLRFHHIPIEESEEPLVDLDEYGFILEPVYYNNGLSDTPKMYLRKTVVERLATASHELAPLKFKIWDGWRPREVQHKIYTKYWKRIAAEHPDWTDAQIRAQVGIFVTIAADLNRIPFHSTGGAVDLTLVDESGAEIDMGTGFDHFGPEAAALHFENDGANQRTRDNRRILRKALTEVEFRYDADEWWHFDYGNQIWAAAYTKPKAIYSEVKSVSFRRQCSEPHRGRLPSKCYCNLRTK